MGTYEPHRRSEVGDLADRRYCSVVLIEPSLSHLDRAFTYAYPSSLPLDIGAHVRVPFRGRNRRGIVLDLSPASDVYRALDVKEALGPGLSDELVALARWTSDRYLSTLGEAVAAAMPQRVAGEESAHPHPSSYSALPSLGSLKAYGNGEVLERALREGGGSVVWRPATAERRGEVIAAMVGAVLARGKGALVLVPEVRVHTETIAALGETFGEGVAWLGADRPARERYRSWLALRSGAKRLAAGGRAAVFAPVPELGLIVIDDEAHASYKEGRAPRFHARTVAAERARRMGATLVLVGTPPSVEARIAAQRSQFTFVGPARGSERSERAPVTVIEAERNVPAARTLAMLKETLASGARAVVIAHRSGVALERIAERTIRIAGPRKPVQLDAGANLAMLHRATRTADCIIATPFIAKDLALSGIVALAIVEADAALAQPEFRAVEDTFATWWRAARWMPGGRIAIETADPAHPAIAALVRWDPDVLVRAEAARRRELRYPPFASLARIDVPAVRADDVAEELRKIGELEVLGPVERDGKGVIVVRGSRRDVLLKGLAPFAIRWRASDEPMRIDVDPWEVFVPKWRS